jgi:4-amino-4-deoxy-L-arabinose transferase-like glycosyltransferase
MDSRPHPPARRLSLVLPAYNEEAGIARAVAEADDALAGLTAPSPAGRVIDYEILVVDDGSRDGTAALVAEVAAARPKVRLLRHDANRGYGAALRTGFAAARFERVAFTDADRQFHLDDLLRLLPLTEEAPVAVGYRADRQDSRLRRFVSGGYNLLARTLLGTGVRDVDCALKVFRREALAELLPETDGFFVNTEMLTRARLLGLRVAEAAVRHRPREHGRSTVSPRDVPRTLAALLPFWWSRVLFPAGPGTEVAPARRAALPALLLLLAVAAVLFFARLRAPLLEPQEPRYAEIPRQMLAEGSFLVPVLHGQPYLDKPPLLYWLVMASYRAFGVHDWAARLVPGAAGVLTVLLTFLWGRRVAGDRAGLCGALALCLSAQFVYRQRMLTMDGLLCLWVVLGLAAAHVALAAPRLRWRWWLLAGVACGLGLLTKGPVALALVGVPVVAYRLLEPRCARVGALGWAALAAVAAAVAAPWYVAVTAREPEFAAYFFWKHNVVRFLAPFDHGKPVWFHLPGLLLGMLPWALLLPGLARFLARRSARTAVRRPAALGFFLLAFLWCLLFFSLAGSKRPVYILPAMPPLALALGCYLDVLLRRHRRAPDWSALWRRTSPLAYRAALLALAAGAGVAVLAGAGGLIKPAHALMLTALAGAGLSLVAGRGRLSWAACGGVTFAVLVVGLFQLQGPYNRQFALRGHLRAQLDLAAAPGAPVVCYPQRWDSVSFYLPRADVRVYGPAERARLVADLRERPRVLLLVKSGPVLEEMLRELPPSVEFVARGRPGAITAGWVRPREEPPPVLVAGR